MICMPKVDVHGLENGLAVCVGSARPVLAAASSLITPPSPLVFPCRDSNELGRRHGQTAELP